MHKPLILKTMQNMDSTKPAQLDLLLINLTMALSFNDLNGV